VLRCRRPAPAAWREERLVESDALVRQVMGVMSSEGDEGQKNEEVVPDESIQPGQLPIDDA
jgi:hypothetical protein